VVASGSVYCWGVNILSLYNLEHWLTPHRMSWLNNVVSVTAAGLAHNCVVTSNPAVECWGANEWGQAPSLVEGLEGEPASLGGGVDFTCALLIMRSGGVECWGQVGENGPSAPRPVAGLSGATSVTADGRGFACASIADGEVECWNTEEMSAEPVSGVSDATAVSGGEGFACALLATGRVACWAVSAEGPGEAAEVSGVSGATAIAAGAGEACVLLEDDEVECWDESASEGAG
jgi:hypothetical protein